MFWKNFRSGVMFIISAFTCPCHLPVTLPIVLVLLAGTPTALWITNHTGWIYGGMAFLFILTLALGFNWLSQPAASECEPHLIHHRRNSRKDEKQNSSSEN